MTFPGFFLRHDDSPNPPWMGPGWLGIDLGPRRNPLKGYLMSMLMRPLLMTTSEAERMGNLDVSIRIQLYPSKEAEV